MNQRSRKITLITLTLAVSITAIFVFLNGRYFIESYWIHKLENKDQRLEASRKLADLKCYRAIPKIIGAFEDLIKEDTKGEVFIVIHGLTIVNTGLVPRESRGKINSKLHPILYSVYLMGEGGIETLKQFRKEKWQVIKIEGGDQVDETPPIYSSKDPKEVTLYEAVTNILDAWENEGSKISEGPEKVQIMLLERL